MSLARARLAEADAIEVRAIGRVVNKRQNGMLEQLFVRHRCIKTLIKIKLILKLKISNLLINKFLFKFFNLLKLLV